MEEDRNQTCISSGQWAARLARESAAAAAAALRLRADVEGCFIGDELWLRGDATDESLDQSLRRLCPTTRFMIRAGDKRELVRMGNLLPERMLPNAKWVPLTELFEISRPPAALPASHPPPVTVSVVRSDQPRPAALLLATLVDWAAYAEVAPAVRLRRLRFAATARLALVAGDPLPPLRGTRLWETDGIAAPCGYTILPTDDAPTLRRVLLLRKDELALFDENGNWQLVPADAFVAARRSAVRFTMESSGTT